MCQRCDDDPNPTLENEDGPTLGAVRDFFMAVLEASEPDAYIRYTGIQIRFHDLVARLKQSHEVGASEPELLYETRLAHGDLILARERLDEAMARTSTLLAHPAYA